MVWWNKIINFCELWKFIYYFTKGYNHENLNLACEKTKTER